MGLIAVVNFQTMRILPSLVPSRPRRNINCDVTRDSLSRSVPGLPQSLDSASRPRNEAASSLFSQGLSSEKNM